MTEQKNATKLMNEATDNASEHVKGINFPESGAVLDQFNSKVDQASELASARVREKQTK